MDNFPNVTFPKFFRLSSAKISDDLSPYFGKSILSPYFSKISLLFPTMYTCFLHTFCVFRFPLLEHVAFMHHAMHVLEAPGLLHPLELDVGLLYGRPLSDMLLYYVTKVVGFFLSPSSILLRQLLLTLPIMPSFYFRDVKHHLINYRFALLACAHLSFSAFVFALLSSRFCPAR